MRAALDVLPVGEDNEGGPVAVYGDLAMAAEIAGIRPPGDLDDIEAVNEYLLALGGLGSEGGGGRRVSSPVAVPVPWVMREPFGEGSIFAEDYAQFERELGWNVLDIERFAANGEGLQDTVTVLDGDFGEDLGRSDLGLSIQMAFDGAGVTLARSSGAMDAAGAADGGSGTLADDDVLVALADALDEHRAYGALLQGSAIDTFSSRAAEDRSDAELCGRSEFLDEAPQGVATGITDEDGAVFIVVLAHGDEAAAQTNADAVRRIIESNEPLIRSDNSRGDPYGELFDLETVEAQGTLVVARLRPHSGTDTRLWHDLLSLEHSLLATCHPDA